MISRVLGKAMEKVAQLRAPDEPPSFVIPGEPQLERPQCPLCKNTKAKVVFEAADTWISGNTEHRFSIVRCSVCAMRYTTPRYREDFRHLAYQGDYPFYVRARNMRENGEAYDLQAARAPFIGRAERLRALRTKPGRLLDLGCGDGFFCDLMRNAGWDVVAVDIEEDVIWHAKEKLKLNAKVIDIEHESLPEGPFDAITMWGVLQLMYEPRKLLERARAQLDPNGIVGIGVSNVRSFGATLFRGHWRGAGVPRHLSHFSPETMERLANWCAYDVEQTYFETPKWVIAGSVDHRISPKPARLVTKAALLSGSKFFGSSRLGDTMEYYLAPNSRT